MGIGAGIDGPENVGCTGIRSPGRPARNDLLYPIPSASLGIPIINYSVLTAVLVNCV